MLKYRFLFIYLIVLILSVGAVCAQEYNISDDNISIVNDDSNVLLTSEFVIDDSNYGDYFDKDSGVILDNSSISDGDVIKLGNINNKNFILDKSLTFSSNLSSDIINNVSFYFIDGSNNSIVENLNIVNYGEKSVFYINNVSDILISDCDMKFLSDANGINVISTEFVDNLTVKNNNILFNGGINSVVINSVQSSIYICENKINSNSYAIRCKDSIVSVFGNEIYVSDDGFRNLSAIYVEDSIGDIFKNNITFFGNTDGSYENSLMSVYNSTINVCDNLMHASLVSCPFLEESYSISSGLEFENCDDLELLNNNITVEYSNVVGLDDVIVAVSVGDCDDVILVNNSIVAKGHTYTYGLHLVDGYNFNISDSLFSINSDGNSSVGINIEESSGVVNNNIVQVYSPYLSYGISEWTDSELMPCVNYTNNIIFGLADVVYGMSLYGVNTYIGMNSMELYGNYTMGIFLIMLNDTNKILNNQITVNGLKNDTKRVDGELVLVRTLGIHSLSGCQIFNNNISSAGNYSIINEYSASGIIDNNLVANLLLGDGSVLDRSNKAVVGNNTPVVTEYELTNSTFFLFFEDEGYLRNTLSLDSLTFVGNFSNLVDVILIDRPLYLLSKNASLNDIGIEVSSTSDVFISNIEFIIYGWDDAILIKNSNNVTVLNNMFNVCNLLNNRCVIAIVDSGDVAVDSNIVDFNVSFNDDVDKTAFYAEFTNNVIFENNIIRSDIHNDSSVFYGFSIDDCDDVVILNNIVNLSNTLNGRAIVLGGENFNILNNTINVASIDDAQGINIKKKSIGLINGNRIIVNGNSASGMNLNGIDISAENNWITMAGNLSKGIVSFGENVNISFNRIDNVASVLNSDSQDDDVETIGVYVDDGNASITDNTIILDTAEYCVIVDSEGIVCNNYLVAREYTGDASVDYDVSKAYVANNTPTMYAAILTGENHVMYYKDGTRYYVKLTDKFGKPLAGSTVVIRINGVNYTRTVDDNGTTSIPLGLNSGNYTVTASYRGVNYYSNATVKNTITILSTVSANDIVKIFRNGTQYFANFVDNKGVPLKNTDVTFNINGVMYTRTTNESGWAKLNINLPPGTYILTAINPSSGEQYASKVTVLSNIVENYDLTKYYKNASQYSLRLLDDKGNPVGAGVSIQLNINGVFYTRTSDENGYVKLNINLPPGTYIVTAEYKGLRVSNTINVLTVLETQDLVMRYHDGSQFKAKVLDGQGRPYAGQTVTYNINGVFYTKISGDDGIAGLTINLPAGEYIITSTYNGLNVANKVTIIG